MLRDWLHVLCYSVQVSRLVILHEEAEDGNAMPDLSQSVATVKHAVDNLIQVCEIVKLSPT